MATKKKGKGKTKAKRKKPPVTKATTRRKTAARKKPAKKALVRRSSAKKATPAGNAAVKPRSAGPSAVTPMPSLPAKTPPGERIGVVTHYYSHLSVAILRLESGMLRVGDVIHIRGHTTDLSQRVESLEVNHAPATEVGPNDDFGLKVVGHVREHDVVYKVRP